MHHAGGDKRDISHRMRVVFGMVKSTLATAGATLNDMAQIHLCLYDLSDFEGYLSNILTKTVSRRE